MQQDGGARGAMALEVHEVAQHELEEVQTVDEAEVDLAPAQLRLHVVLGEKRIARLGKHRHVLRQRIAQLRLRVDADCPRARRHKVERSPVADSDFDVGTRPQRVMDAAHEGVVMLAARRGAPPRA
jgi:hypothetical protein